MFADLICDDWDSTKNQDDFIKCYFNVKKVNSAKACMLKSVDKSRNINIIKEYSSNVAKDNNEDSSSNSHLLKKKRSLNCQLECSKKRKKEKNSLLNPSDECHSKIQFQSQNIQMASCSNHESNHVKKKKNKSKNKTTSNEYSEKIKVTEDSNTAPEDSITEMKTTSNFSANLINETEFQKSDIDSNYLKLKKKKKRLRTKANSISEQNFAVSDETETINDNVFNDFSITNTDSLENNSGSNTLKMKKRKKTFKNNEKSLEPDKFSDGEEINNCENQHNMSINKNNLSNNNFDSNCLKKKKKKSINSGKSVDCEFSDTTEHTSFGSSCDLTVKKSDLLQNKAYQKLQAAKFRYLNEMLYTNSGKDALSYFQQNTDEFMDYHQGYQSQVSKWPINPVDIIIQEIRQINKQAVIADLGCGEAKIAEVFPKRTVHSFDLIALKDCVTACDMTNVPLPSKTADVVVFCLSLMGTNWKDYLKEAHRILKLGGIMKIAEIESRIENLQHFIKEIENFGFSLINQNLSHKMFVFLNFKKVNRSKKPSKIPAVTLKPCLYKKR